MKKPYTCTCCGYNSMHKNTMRRHLYKKIPCPQVVNTIVLTEEIKQCILANRIYKIPPPPRVPQNQTIYQQINYNNIINNLIVNMESVEKLNKFISHNNVELIEYGDTIENKFQKQLKGFNENDDRFGVHDGLILDKGGLLDVVDQVTTLANEHCDNMNVLYEKKFNKLKLFDMGKWDDFILIQGICTLVSKIQECYFNAYECFLIRKIEFSSLGGQDKCVLKEQLTEYYKFIGCFELSPFVKDKNDTEILYAPEDERCDPSEEWTDDNTELSLRYTAFYSRVCDETKTSEFNKTKKSIVDIVKKNCLKNVDELNKRVMSLFNMDEEFKKTIIPVTLSI